MTTFSAIKLEKWIENRIFSFFNQANSYLDLTLGLLKDDPANGHGYVLGQVVAERILERRASLPGNRFDQLSQFDHIHGLGEDKIRDIIYSLGMPADEAFRNAMFEEVLSDEWRLDFHAIQVEDEGEFMSLVNDPEKFKRRITREVGMYAVKRFQDPTAPHKARKRMAQSYAECFPSGNIGSFAFALWFFRFDLYAGFTFDQIQEVTESYLNFFPFRDNQIELRLFKGFQNQGLLSYESTVTDLPVVVNFAEQRITLWVAERQVPCH
ncbi:MAG: hypothetical protein H6581_25145 [Bacteroidia bacterium]|nr:hypothetical protein [Bacteroidia bacterium]